MKTTKRNGELEEISFDKITKRLQNASIGSKHDIDFQAVAQKVIDKIVDGITTNEIDVLILETLMGLFGSDSVYDKTAVFIYISNLHKNTEKKFSNAFKKLYREGIVLKEYNEFVQTNKHVLNSMIVAKNDYQYTFFGLKTLAKTHLQKIDNNLVETPQFMFLRVAIQLFSKTENPLPKIAECYNSFSDFKATPATPILRNSCTTNGNLASCYLFTIEDNLDHIMKVLTDQAYCSKVAGGLGMSITNIRSKGSKICATGSSLGVVPMLKMYNSMVCYIGQDNIRKGSVAAYMEPWHPDVLNFLDIKKKGGDESIKCKQVYTALYVPDLFYKKLLNNEPWYFLDPSECPGLTDTFGDDFESLYSEYVEAGKFRKKLEVAEFRELFNTIVTSQIETGNPYIVNKDHVNQKSNQEHIGIIKSSNLCAEICLVSNENEHGTCNLSSISLPKHLYFNNKTNLLEYDFEALGQTTRQVVRNLNQVLDTTTYIRSKDGKQQIPIEAQNCNERHRPLGIGIQGLADVFAMLKFPWESKQALLLNKNIMRTIYYFALSESVELAKLQGPYKSFKGSNFQKGKFQFDMWKNFDYNESGFYIPNSDFENLKKEVQKHGIRNSMLTALMPTASTSQILGNNECFDPFHSNLFTRNTLAGADTILNKHLVADLKKYNLWNESMKYKILEDGGSIQKIQEIPIQLKEIYKTVYEIPNTLLIQMAADRAPYVDHSQSMNMYYTFGNEGNDSRAQDIAKNIILAWRLGLKTGVYYTHSQEAFRGYKLNVQDFCTDSCGA